MRETLAPLLTVDAIVAGYGGGEVLHGVSLEVRDGEVVCLLGPNGAGKTTLLRAIAGLLRPRAGHVRLAGRDVTRTPPHIRARRGVALVPEERSAFGELTVDQNLTLGAMAQRRARDPRWLRDHKAEVFELFPVLHERSGQLARTLSGGEQKMLVIGRALMSEPMLLLVDEPSQGLAPQLVASISDALIELHKERQVSVIVAEQNLERVLGWAHRAYVLSGGRVQHQGPAAELRDDDELMEKLYLGDYVDRV